MSLFHWIKKNKLPCIFFSLLLLLTILTISQTLFTSDIDLRITKVQTQHLSEAFLYKVKLKASNTINSPTYLHFLYEDGSKEILPWNTDQSSCQIDVKSTKRLEYLFLNNLEVPEKNIENNNKPLQLWSDQLSLYTSYSIPEYSFLTDAQGRFWFAASGRIKTDEKPSITLTVLSPEGKILINNQQISTNSFYNRYPALIEQNNQIHVIWSGYQNEGEQRILFHTTFTESNATLVQSSVNTTTDSQYSLIRPIIANKHQTSPICLVEVENDAKSSFCLYNLTESGLHKVGLLHDQSVFKTTGFIKEVTLFPTTDGDYQLIWTQQHYKTNIYYTRFTSDGTLIITPKCLSESFSNSRIHHLNIVPNQDKLYYFWSYTSVQRTSLYHIFYMITDFDGNIVRNKSILLGPSRIPIRDLFVTLDKNSNFDLVWVDGRFGNVKPMAELVFQKITPDLEVLIPAYRLTTNTYYETAPNIINNDNIRSLVWHTFDNGKYQVFMKTTDPRFVSEKHQLQETLIKFWNILLATLASLGLQAFLILPLNFTALISALIFTILLATNKLRNNWITWASILLFILLMKLYSYNSMANQLGQFHLINIADCYKITLSTLMLTILIYFLYHKFSKKDTSSNEIRFLYIIIWFFLDSFTLLLLDNLLMFS